MKSTIKRSVKNTYVRTGFFFVMILFLLTVIGFFYLPYSPEETGVSIANQSPSFTHLLGTDHLGRDLLSRIMVAGRAAFGTAFLATGLAALVGVSLGMVAGYFSGWVDSIISKVLDTMRSLPGVLCAMMIIAVFGKNFYATTFSIAFILTPNFARIARSATLQAKEQGYIVWTKVAGIGSFRTILKHIFPNILPQLVVTLTMSLASCILTESALSYLGLGVQPPHPSLGQMLSEAQNTIVFAPWQTLIIGGVITTVVLGYHLIGDGLSDILSNKEE